MVYNRERDNNIQTKNKKILASMVVTDIHRLAFTQRLQLHELVIIASFRQKLIMCARLAHFAFLDEVAV